ncbi:MAG: helix-turn-helix domain-containing protein [Acidimicrobiales bacterium]|jgi:excisionase family DNA binding protein
MASGAECSTRLQKPAAAPPLPELVRLDEVAKALCVTERHLRRLIAERRIPFVKVGYFIRFDPHEIARWVTAHRVEVRGPQGRRR